MGRAPEKKRVEEQAGKGKGKAGAAGDKEKGE
jgi:hypothetical protein